MENKIYETWTRDKLEREFVNLYMVLSKITIPDEYEEVLYQLCLNDLTWLFSQATKRIER